MPEIGMEMPPVEISKEVPADFGKELSGRLVTFGEGENMAWGIEVDIQVTSDLRAYLAEQKIHLPDNIKNIKFLTLSPQESLPKDLRNIPSTREIDSRLQFIADVTRNHNTGEQGKRPYDYLGREFTKVIPSDSDVENFEDITRKSQGSEILIVQGHGGGDPVTIGEQSTTRPIGPDGAYLQRAGNDVQVYEILEKYNDPSRFSVIMLDSCYSGNKLIEAKRVPIISVQGISGFESTLRGTRKTMFSYPAGTKTEA